MRKAAQAAAFFALKSGGAINVLKLSKLLYLAERASMAKYDEPMFYDDLVAMPDGPVASITLNLINGEIEEPIWKAFVARREEESTIRPQNGVDFNHLDQLSEADIGILEELWGQFGHWDRWVLREWDDSSTPKRSRVERPTRLSPCRFGTSMSLRL